MGSDITIAVVDSAKKYRRKVHPSELKEVQAANDEAVVIIGKAKEYLSVADRTESLISTYLQTSTSAQTGSAGVDELSGTSLTIEFSSASVDG